MKKTAVAVSVVMALGVGMADAATMSSATFTVLDPTGGLTLQDTTVTGSIGGGTWSVASTTPFSGLLWTAHGGTTFGPGTYTFNTVEGGTYTGVVVGPGQVGGHILFDWAVSTNIDVVLVWDVANGTYTSVDGPGFAINSVLPTDPYNMLDGVRGYAMADGPFTGFNVNFDFTVVPVPAAVWLFGSGLMALIGIATRKTRV